MPSLWSEILRFLGDFVLHWQSYVTGGVVTGAIGLAERLLERRLSKRAYFLIFVVSFSVVAFFMTWRDQYERAQTAETKLSTSPSVQKIELTLPPSFERFLERHSGEVATSAKSATGKKVTKATATEQSASAGPKGNVNPDTQKPAEPAKPSEPAIPIPPVESLYFTQRIISSTNADQPHAIELVVQSNVDIEPVSLVVICKSEACDLRPRFSAMNVRIGHVTGHSNWGILAFDFPKLTPARPLVIEVDSKEDNEVLSVRRFALQ